MRGYTPTDIKSRKAPIIQSLYSSETTIPAPNNQKEMSTKLSRRARLLNTLNKSKASFIAANAITTTNQYAPAKSATTAPRKAWDN